MIRILNGTLVALSILPAISLVAKATVVLAFTLIAAWFARRKRAAVRHALLAANFGVLLALPIVSILARPIPITVRAARGNNNIEPLFDHVSMPSSGPPTSERPNAAAGKLGWALPPLPIMLLGGWLVWAAFFMMKLVRGLQELRSLRRFGLPWRHAQALADGLAAGVHRRIQVLLHESLEGPVTFGILRPLIVLPADAQNWDEQDLDRALVHELEHVRRNDWAIHCLARLACAVYWFHPLVWTAWRQLTLAAERSCDDAVLKNSEATAYADQLVGLARKRSKARRSPALAMANRSDLASRVSALLNSRQQRGRAGALVVVLACAAASLLSVTMSPLMVVTAQSSAPSATPLKFEAASIRLCNPNESTGVARSGAGGGAPAPAPGRLTIRCESTEALILYAYDLYASGPRPQLNEARSHLLPSIEGAPSWVKSERYRIDAKPEHPASLDEMRGPMLRNLLEDRFQLRLHRQPHEVPGYALTVARGGPKLTPFPDGGCWRAGEQPDPERPFCGMNKAAKRGTEQGAPLLWDVPGLNATGIAKLLERYLNRPVVDRTGITGMFEVRMEFAWDESITPLIRRDCSPDCGPLTGPGPDRVPSIFTAVQQQLGLKLEPMKSSGDTLVIDHIEKPSEN